MIMEDKHVQLLEHFYTSFDKLDSKEMIRCYHDDLTFEDPAFGELNYYYGSMMWQMLCDSQQGKDFRVNFRDLQVEGETGSLIWEAEYDFRTGRRVHNIIHAKFIIILFRFYNISV